MYSPKENTSCLMRVEVDVDDEGSIILSSVSLVGPEVTLGEGRPPSEEWLRAYVHDYGEQEAFGDDFPKEMGTYEFTGTMYSCWDGDDGEEYFEFATIPRKRFNTRVRRDYDPLEGDVFSSPTEKPVIKVDGRSPRRVDVTYDPCPNLAPIAWRLNKWRSFVIDKMGYRLQRVEKTNDGQ